jgi:hypothetical protein
MLNGATPQPRKPAAPPEVSSWVIEKTPPDLLAWARQTLNEAEVLADLEEVRRTGGMPLEDFLGKIEERTTRGG